MSDRDPGFWLNIESDLDLAAMWRRELLASSDFEAEPVDADWPLGDEYRRSPFEVSRIRQVLAVGTQHPEAVIYNCGTKPLGFRQQERFRDTYQWFYDNAGLEAFDCAPLVVVGSHLHRIVDAATGKSRRRLGMFDPEGGRPVISLSLLVFKNQIPQEAWRYRELLKRGIPLAEIILGHELSHALAVTKDVERYFAAYVGWEERTYDTPGGEHTVRGLGHLAAGEASTTVTELGFTEPAEDLAESGVFYRSSSQLVGAERTEFFTHFFASLRDYGREDPLPGSHVRVVELPGRIYPVFHDR